MENLCNFYRFLSLARLLIPRIFVFRRLLSYSKRPFLSAPRFFTVLMLFPTNGDTLSQSRTPFCLCLVPFLSLPPHFCFSALMLFPTCALLSTALHFSFCLVSFFRDNPPHFCFSALMLFPTNGDTLSQSRTPFCLCLVPFLSLPPHFCFSALMLFPTCALLSTAPRPVSLSALCLSFAIIPRIFVFQRLCSFQPARFSLPPRAPYRFSSLSTYCRHETYHPRLLFSSHFFRTLCRRIRLNGIPALVFFVFFQHGCLSRRPLLGGDCGGVASFLADCLSSDCATQLNCLTHFRKSDRIKARKVFGKHFRIKKPR